MVPLRVLVADDNFDCAQSLALLLEMSDGHAVRVVSNGQEALAAIHGWLPDVVFLDLDMPIMDGIAAGHAIRAALPHVVLIALSGHSENEAKRRAFDAGFNHFYVKGVPFRHLRVGLQQAFDYLPYRLRDSLQQPRRPRPY